MAKTKWVWKNPYMYILEALDQETGQISAESPKPGFFGHILFFFT